MRVAMLARAEDRGLGIQSWEFYRHLHPERVAIVDLGPELSKYPNHPERYPGALTWPLVPGPTRRQFLEWVDGCDVLYTAETAYWPDVFKWCREAGVRSVVHANWEFFGWAVHHDWPAPDLFLMPSTWNRKRWPPNARYLPMPVATDRLEVVPDPGTPRHFLHVVGSPAAHDRNGTVTFMAAARHVRSGAELTARTQAPLSRSVLRAGAELVNVHSGTIDGYWRLYDGADVLVIPRRYGGQCLPANEALARGVPVIMADVEPQRTDLRGSGVELVQARRRGTVRCHAGTMDVYDVRPEALAKAIDGLTRGDRFQELRRQALEFRAKRSWQAMLPEYLTALSGK